MKKLFTILFAVALGLNLSAQVPNYVPSDGLVAWYPLDAGTYEISDLMPLHPPINSENRFGAVDGSTFFDGNQELTTPGISYYDFTISTWFLSNDVEEDVCGGIVSQNTGLDCTPLVHIAACYSPMALHCQVRETNCVADQVSADLSPLFWQHLVFHREGNLIRTYLNGVLAEEDSAIQDEIAPDVQLRIGAMPYGGQFRGFHGSIDDIGIWNRALTEEEILALYNAQLPVPGCTDSIACNFNEEANIEDDSCVYPLFGEDCETGGAACGEGTIWDANIQACVVSEFCQEDLDGDGVIGINDLMQLLSSFGTMCEEPETVEFTCGDAMNYHGYDYATVQIGEQCWFAENLRTELYQNGDTIPANYIDSEWFGTTNGVVTVYGENGLCYGHSPDGDACDPEWSLNEYGRLYNRYAVDDERGLCPSGWHVSTDEGWMILEMELGMSNSDANSTGYRGTDQGTQMKTTYGWAVGGNGINTSGFSGLPGGIRTADGYFDNAGTYGTWWSPSSTGFGSWIRTLFLDHSNIYRIETLPWHGRSVRCVRD